MPSADEAGGSFTLRLARSMQGLAGLASWIDQIAAELALPSPQEYALRLCLEEAVVNVVMHGRPVPGVPAETVGLQVSSGPDALHVTIEDRCAPFDPLRQPAPDAQQGLEEREVGGWGIHLMRQFASSLAYQRLDNVNRLALTIKRTPDTSPACGDEPRSGSTRNA